MPKPGLPAATALVIASMIGTGVFTSLGYQLVDLRSGPQVLILWAMGGVVALCGAFCYAAVAEEHPRSGGEHHFLGVLFHPALGFMAGMLSAIVGFAAPTAASAIALGEYLHASFPALPVTGVALVVIALGTLAHAISSAASARVQLVATSLKLILIAGFIVAALTLPGKGDIAWDFDTSRDFAALGTPAFAVALYFVFYSYSGWNAAVYGLEEWEKPAQTVRRALIGGTLAVTGLYLALNAAFLWAAPVAALQGQNAVGEIAGRHLFGADASRWISCLFAIGLFASVSAMLWAGPRVLASMGRQVPALKFLTPSAGAPRLALAIQAGLAVLFTLISEFRELVVYIQTGLTLCTLLVAAGSFRLKHQRKPVAAALVFLAFTTFVIVRSILAEPIPVTFGLATALGCCIVGLILPKSTDPS